MENPKDEILRGVKTLPKLGIPGRLSVIGRHAYPILSGDNPSDVLLAAAYHEKGKIVAWSHNGYLKRFMAPEAEYETIMKNLQRWLVGEELSNLEQEVMKVDGLPKLAEGHTRLKVVVWEGGNTENPQLIEDIQDFVAKGGALVTGICPWGWRSSNPTKNLMEISAFDILHKVGIYYLEGYLKGTNDGFIVGKHTSGPFGHLDPSVDIADKGKEEEEEDLMQAFLTCSRIFDHLPTAILRKHLPKKLDRLWDDLHRKIEARFPTPDKPAKTKEDRAFATFCNDSYIHTPDTKIPGIHVFPFDLETCPELMCGEVEKKSTKFKGDCLPTGFYAVAGQKFKVEVKSKLDDKAPWHIMIGCHTDDLTKCNSFRRWPKLSHKKKIRHELKEFGSPFGGLIYLKSPGVEGSTIKVTLEDVIQAPHFDMNDKDCMAKWHASKSSPAPWADIEGKFISITLPTSSLQGIDDPTAIMETWDEVVASHYHLLGKKAEDERRQWVVTDEQPDAGYMHAGYPVVTMMDVADPKHKDFLLTDKLKDKGQWGMFHELGHNMQEDEWTFNGTVEVTCNLFTLHAMDVLCKREPWIHDWLQGQFDKAAKYLKDGADFSKWKKEPGVALFIYSQLQACFGWEAYRSVFIEYNGLSKNEKPKKDDDKIEQWMQRFSIHVDFNLTPLFKFWGFDIPSTVEDKLAKFPWFLPDDDITRAVPDRTEEILKAFPNCKRKTYAAAKK